MDVKFLQVKLKNLIVFKDENFIEIHDKNNKQNFDIF